MRYKPHVSLSRATKPDSAVLGGDQLLFNGVPIRPMSAVGGEINFDVVYPFRASCGVLPAGAWVFGALVAVGVLFNAGTTNVLTVGTLADPDLLVEAGDVNEGAVATTMVCHRAAPVLTEDTEFFVWFTQTGVAATTGSAGIGLLYGIP